MKKLLLAITLGLGLTFATVTADAKEVDVKQTQVEQGAQISVKYIGLYKGVHIFTEIGGQEIPVFLSSEEVEKSGIKLESNVNYKVIYKEKEAQNFKSITKL